MEASYMAVICDYSGIAEYYEDWCTGDNAYLPAATFYMDYLSDYYGVFAELGVGTGRIARPVSLRKDVTVYGIDSCSAMLDQCRAQMCSDMKLTLMNVSFLDFDLPQKADIIYMPFRTIGYVLRDKDMETLFKCVYNNLKSEGLFVFDHYMFSKKWAEEHNDMDIPMYSDSLNTIVDRYRYDFSKCLMHCVVKCNDRVVTTFDFRWFSPKSLKLAFKNQGFVCQALYGDFDKSLWNHNSPNQIWILGKGA
jgi:hypothetical protein